jgi:hypothetical protein
MPQQAVEDEELECMAYKLVKKGDSVVIEREGTMGNGVVPARETKSQMLCHCSCQSWKGQ